MKIKRYTAASMRAALALVRAEQGPDAVILSSRRGEEGIEVIAAVDYDEALFAAANRQRQASATISAVPAAPAPAPLIEPLPAAVIPAAAATPPAAPVRTQIRVPASTTAPASAAVRATVPASRLVPPAPATPAPRAARATATDLPVAPRTAAAVGEMQQELKDMRRLLENGLAGMTWNDRRLREPLQARVLEELTALNIAPDVAMALAALTPRRTSLKNPAHLSLALLCKHLSVVDDLSSVMGGVTALVGPTGAGKTTTIAKLAARWCLQHGSQDVALVSTDGYRIGAREQLLTYARILGVPMHPANSGRELARVLERLSSKKLVLIDTAGMGPRDVRLTEQLAALKLGAARARVLLALPAQGEGQALDEIVRAFAGMQPAGCILTKVDEAASLGAVLSATLRHKLKIAYICNGQRVPEDLHAAAAKRVWLVRAALDMKERAPPARNEAYLARHFGRVPAHA
jgi:flagellar biosynthesis protein FlhF